MNDKVFQEKFDSAWILKKQGNFEEAMSLYSELYEQLIKDGFERTGGVTDSEKGDQERINSYLKGDKLACTILNNMAVILAEAGNKNAARNYFELSIKLTPENFDYQDPIIGLKELE